MKATCPLFERPSGMRSFCFDSNYHTREEAIEETRDWAERAFAALGLYNGFEGPEPESLRPIAVVPRDVADAFDDANEQIAETVRNRIVSGAVVVAVLAGIYWFGPKGGGQPIYLGNKDHLLVDCRRSHARNFT
jgi:hypothetical protein